MSDSDNLFYGVALSQRSVNQPPLREDSLQWPQAGQTDTSAHAYLSLLEPMARDVLRSARLLESIEDKVDSCGKASDQKLHEIGDRLNQMENSISKGNSNLSSFLQDYMHDLKENLLKYVKDVLDQHLERQTVELKIMMQKTMKGQNGGPEQPGTVHSPKDFKRAKTLEPYGGEGDSDPHGADDLQMGACASLRKEADSRVAAKLKKAIVPIQHKLKDLKFGNQMHAEAGDVLQQLVAGIPFQLAVLLAIACQAVFLGWEANDQLVKEFERLEGQRRDTSPPAHVKIVSAACSIFFSLELILRIVAWKRKFFDLSDKEFLFWNIFDVALCLGMLLELVNHGLAWFRVVRLLRVARVLRIASMFAKLRKMVYALMNSMSALLWLLVLLTITLYMFTLAFMQGAQKYLQGLDSNEFDHSKEEKERMWIIRHKFGSLFLTMRSLYAAITGGDPWDYLFEPIMADSWMYSIVAIGFVLFFVFAFMNVVTGVFVDEAMKIAQLDRDAMVADAMQSEERMAEDIKAFVANVDHNNDGKLTIDELISVLMQERVQQWLIASEIDLNPDNAQRIFRDLDPQRTGKIDAEEFIDVLSKLQGHARSADLFLLTYDIKLEQKDLALLLENQHFMMDRFEKIHSQS